LKPQSFDSEAFLEKIIHFAKSEVYREKLERALSLLNEEKPRKIVAILGNGVEAVNSVPTAIYCFTKNHQDYRRAVTYAVSLGGDSDTIGAMTGAIAGAHQDQENLVGTWRQKLEKRDYIENLAEKLWKLKLEL
jgi:poly(ADP-ribose) glycohydrolase ARH3